MTTDDCAWNQWLAQHGQGLLLAARQYVPTLSDAEDVLQDAFVRFWRSRANATDPVAYCYACVRTAALDWLRTDRSRRRRDHAAAQQMAAESAWFVPSPGIHELPAQIESALRSLPQNQRTVLTLKIWGGLTFSQIGEVESISAATAASRYRYALQALRQKLPPGAYQE